MNEKKTAEEYFHLSKNEFGKMWLMYNPEGGGRYKCWEPISGEFWNEFEKLQNAAQETAALREENERLKEALKEEKNKYNDLYNSVYTHFQTLIARNYNNIGVWSNEKQQYNFELISELEDILKSHNARKLTNHPNDSGK